MPQLMNILLLCLFYRLEIVISTKMSTKSAQASEVDSISISYMVSPWTATSGNTTTTIVANGLMIKI